ncbi:hypothetical protein [Neobacillus niacini]|uniref:hypothetical protein n=1 Tax=Neobacillus niacini TaxID=86668 RepID=UPI00285EFE6F|nr:hypothetical protein [Neobacillus niacini]MDR7000987.1 uncharacterized protein YhaN [Neobacillus niacini]
MMEQGTILKEILSTLKLHSENMDKKFKQTEKKFEQKFDQVDERFNRIEKRLDRMEKKMDGFHVEITEAQETLDFTAKKTLQHEKKLRELKHQ